VFWYTLAVIVLVLITEVAVYQIRLDILLYSQLRS